MALADLIQARLFLATLLYEHAQSYETGSAEHKKLLEESAAAFESAGGVSTCALPAGPVVLKNVLRGRALAHYLTRSGKRTYGPVNPAA